jgi:hypothetical protein
MKSRFGLLRQFVRETRSQAYLEIALASEPDPEVRLMMRAEIYDLSLSRASCLEQAGYAELIAGMRGRHMLAVDDPPLFDPPEYQPPLRPPPPSPAAAFAMPVPRAQIRTLALRSKRRAGHR